jgi:hypothetical protein
MRRSTFAILLTSAFAISACGSGAMFANRPRPPTPVNLTVYINDSRVSVSPSSVGAGPVVFIVTNAASNTETLTVHAPGGGALANTGPINPQATAQVIVDFRDPGEYTVSTGTPARTEAAQATQAVSSSIQSATLHIGKPRPSASNALLQP